MTIQIQNMFQSRNTVLPILQTEAVAMGLAIQQKFSIQTVYFHWHLSAKAHMDPCKQNWVFLWHIFYPPQLVHEASVAVLQRVTWHFIQITWFLLVSHALRDAWSFWHQLIPHSALETTLALIFSHVFRSFQEAHTMLLLVTQPSKLWFTDTNSIRLCI